MISNTKFDPSPTSPAISSTVYLFLGFLRLPSEEYANVDQFPSFRLLVMLLVHAPPFLKLLRDTPWAQNSVSNRPFYVYLLEAKSDICNSRHTYGVISIPWTNVLLSFTVGPNYFEIQRSISSIQRSRMQFTLVAREPSKQLGCTAIVYKSIDTSYNCQCDKKVMKGPSLRGMEVKWAIKRREKAVQIMVKKKHEEE